MPVVFQKIEGIGDIERRESGHFQLHLVLFSARHGLDRKAGGLVRINDDCLGFGQQRVGVAHLYFHHFFGLVPATIGGKGDFARTGCHTGFQLEADHLVPSGGKGDFLRGSPFYPDVAACLHTQCHLLDGRFRDKHINRKFYAFSHADNARHGGKHHQRRTHSHCLFRGPVGPVLCSHHHHAHSANILRQLDTMAACGAFAQCIRPHKAHHGIKAVHLGGGQLHGFVTAHAEHSGVFAGKSADNVVIHIPSANAQGLSGIKAYPRVGCLEIGQAQKTFIHNG